MDNKYSNNYSIRPQSYNSFSNTSNIKTNVSSFSNQQPKLNTSQYTNNGSLLNQSNNLNQINKDGFKYAGQSNTNSFSSLNRFPQLNLQGSSDLGRIYKAQDFQNNSNKFTSNTQGIKDETYSMKSNIIPSQSYDKKQEFKGKDENNLSWTKYISMQFKTQELQKSVANQKSQIQQKTKKIAQLERTLFTVKYENDKAMKQQERKYQAQLYQQKTKYQAQLQNRTRQVKNLLQKVSDQTKSCLSQQMKAYLSQIINGNSQIKTQYTQLKQQRADLVNKVSSYEQQLQSNKQIIQKQAESIVKLTLQLSKINERLSTRVTTSNDSNSVIQIIQSQAIQIEELIANFENIQDQYIKLRSTLVQTENKLKSIQNQNRLNYRKQKQDNNNFISELSFKISQKQYECTSLTRKLKTLQTKLKTIFQQNQIKKYTIQTLESRLKNSKNAELQQILQELIRQFLNKSQNCTYCIQKQQQLTNLRTKLNLLQN